MEYIKVLLPSLCVALLFWYVIRAIIRADSIERREMDRYYADLEDSDKQGGHRPGESAAAAPNTVTETEPAPESGPAMQRAPRLSDQHRRKALMAREMKLVLTDDFDGTDAAETVSFSIDQGHYEIELSSENAAKLREALAPFIERARRVANPARGTRSGSGRSRRSAGSRSDTPQIRKWAQDKGYEVSDRGRIPSEIIEAYDNAH